MIDILIMIMILIFMLIVYHAGKRLLRKKFPLKKDIWDGSDVQPGYDMLSKADREIQKKNKFKMNR